MISKKSLFLWILAALLSAACNSQQTSSMNTYNWIPNNTAPANYPVYLYRGYFTGADSSLISTPDRQTLYYGWQKIGGVYMSGRDLKPAPRQLDLLWLSYSEDTYYQAQISLPVEKITSLFEQGYLNPKTEKKETYDTISYGIAPGGFVAVWVIGVSHRIEVAIGQGKVTEIDFKEMIPGSGQSQQEHINSRLQTHVQDSVIAEIKKGNIPFKRWKETYRTKYLWSPEMSHQAKSFTPLTVEMNFFNGEQDVRFFDLLEVENDSRKAVPMYFRLEWRDKNSNLFASRLNFNEQEIYGAFKKLSDQAGGQEMQVVARISRYNDEITVALNAGDASIPLPKTEIDIFAKDD